MIFDLVSDVAYLLVDVWVKTRNNANRLHCTPTPPLVVRETEYAGQCLISDDSSMRSFVGESNERCGKVSTSRQSREESTVQLQQQQRRMSSMTVADRKAHI